MKRQDNLEDLITYLYRNFNTFKGHELIKDTSRISSIKFDSFIDSSVSNPLSFTIFELSDKGEMLIDNVSKVIESEAAFFLFINPEHNWMFMVKNTTENQKKLINREKVENFKIKIL